MATTLSTTSTTAAAAAAAASTAISNQRKRKSSSTAPPTDTSLLPWTYQHLIKRFPAIYAIASMCWHRNQPCTFEQIKGTVGPAFTFSHFRQLIFLAPDLLQLQPAIFQEATDKDDPFAPKQLPTHERTIEGQYELLSTRLLERAKNGWHATDTAPAAFQRSRNEISRPIGKKPEPKDMVLAFEAFKRSVVAYFARPDATMQIPECPLPPHLPLDEIEYDVPLTIPKYSKLNDALTVGIEANTDAATRPKPRHPPPIPVHVAAASTATSSTTPSSVSPLDRDVIMIDADDDADADSDVEIIDVKKEVEVVKRPSRRNQTAAAAAAASSSSVAAASSSVASPSIKRESPSVASSAAASYIASTMDSDDSYSYAESPLLPNLMVHLKQQKFFKKQIEYVHHIPARHAITVEILQRNPNTPVNAVPSSSFVAAPSSASTAAAALNLGAEAPVILSRTIYQALRAHQPSITRLFLHQSQAINALLVDRKQVVVVATPTSSGKSFCYSIPLAETLVRDSQARALALFPTKALAQDQLRSLRGFIQQMAGAHIVVDTYDGDTPSGARIELRERCRVLLTNPDMLHVSMLPFHHQFIPFLKNLKFVILDETHVYRGQFGAHLCLILRRLRRLCSHYGSNPQFVFCSATIGNAKSFVSTLVGVPENEIVLVDEDGSARGEKQFLLWNPPLDDKSKYTPPQEQNDPPPTPSPPPPRLPSRNQEQKSDAANSSGSDGRSRFQFDYLNPPDVRTRRSTFMEAAILLANLIQINYRTICFGGTRKVVEVVSDWTRQVLSCTKSTRPLIPLVETYRGGYTIEDRRRVEKALFSGKLRGIISTNALELGIDIGTLDVTMHIGLPPTMANLLQQSGRSGRGVRPSLSILLVHDNPLDQYYMKHPNELFSRRSEKCIVDFESPYHLRLHLMCAAAELPLNRTTDAALFGPAFQGAFDELLNEKMWLARRPIDPNHPSKFDDQPCYDLLNGPWEKELEAMRKNSKYANSGPASYFSIRNMSQKQFQVIDSSSGVRIDETEERRAIFDLHPNAIYSNQGREYVVLSMDRERFQIMVKRVFGQTFYTHCVDHKRVTILSRWHAFSTSAENQAAGEQKAPKVEAASMQAQLTSPQLGVTVFGGASSALSGINSLLPQQHPVRQPLPFYLDDNRPLTWVEFCSYGRVKIDTSVYGYHRFSKLTGKPLSNLPIPLSGLTHEFETWACWIDLPKSIILAFEKWYFMQHPPEQIPQIMAQTNASPSDPTSPNKRPKLESSTSSPSSVTAAAAAGTSSASSPSLPIPIWSEVMDDFLRAHASAALFAGLHGVNHCLISLMPMYLLCNGSEDLNSECPSLYEQNYETRHPRAHRLLLFERVASAGPAFMKEASQVLHRLVGHVREVLETCPCRDSQHGCPSCIQSHRCSELNDVLDKEAALWLATALDDWSREYDIPG